MKVSIKQHQGSWSLGYSLDKQVIKSFPIGENEQGHMQFDTTRTEVGEAMFQLKYRDDLSQVQPIASQLHHSLVSEYFASVDLIIPMPPSKIRPWQPVAEVVKELSKLSNIRYSDNLLTRNPHLK